MSFLLRVLLALAVLPALPLASAQAAPPGINLGTTRTDTGMIQPVDVDDAKAAGAHSVRIFVDWAAIETADDVYVGIRVQAMKDSAARARQLGIVPLFVVFHTPGWANGNAGVTVPPADAAKYAEFVGYLANQLKQFDPVWEIWNEQDEKEFWATPDPVRYAALLKAAKVAIDAQDPEATVLFGALTGNNYEYLEAAIDKGALDATSFDGVAVHTDTACLTRAPDFFVRNVGPGLDGRINRFSFLGFREVRDTLLARNIDKPIWMTELGWATFTGACELPNVEAGRLGGVTAAEQAAFTTRAYQCLANYPYVEQALLFDLRDRGPGRMGQYGILGKPAYDAFVAVPDDGYAGQAFECGDFTAPSVTPQLRVRRFVGSLPIYAKASDPSGITRLTLKVDGKEIRNFTGADIGNDKLVGLDWQGAKQLAPGKHTITVEALDQPSNVGKAEVVVEKLDVGNLQKTETTTTEVTGVRVRRGREALVTGYVNKAFDLQLRGKVAVRWELRKGGKWKKIHGGLKAVKISPTGERGKVRFSQKLREKGQWRVKLIYGQRSSEAIAPYTPSASKWVTFRAR